MANVASRTEDYLEGFRYDVATVVRQVEPITGSLERLLGTVDLLGHRVKRLQPSPETG